MTFKEFELKVEYVANRCGISMHEILKWTVKDLYRAYELLI